jgi:hypothetical protein
MRAEDFTLKNRPIRLWFAGVIIVVLLVVAFFPPGFWLCDIGALLFAIGTIANSGRTDQWWSWQREGKFNWFEGWCVVTGAILATVPLLAIVVRSLR